MVQDFADPFREVLGGIEKLSDDFNRFIHKFIISDCGNSSSIAGKRKEHF